MQHPAQVRHGHGQQLLKLIGITEAAEAVIASEDEPFILINDWPGGLQAGFEGHIERGHRITHSEQCLGVVSALHRSQAH